MRPLTALALCAAAGLALPSIATRHAAARAAARDAIDPAARWPVRFETNRGQSRRPAAFLGEAGDQHWRFRLGSIEVEPAAPDEAADPIRLTWVGSSPFRLEPLEPLPLRSHYIDDPNPARRQRDIPNFGALQYRNVYRGIDVRFHGVGGRLGHDFTLAEGADPKRIRMRFDGALEMHVAADGALHVDGRGESALVLAKPAAYQGHGDAKTIVTALYRLDALRHEVAFDLGAYDPAQPLTIGVPGPLSR